MVGLLTPLPSDPQASQTMSLLGSAPMMPAPVTPKPPQMPVDPMTATNAWATAMNRNAYGTADPQTLGVHRQRRLSAVE